MTARPAQRRPAAKPAARNGSPKASPQRASRLSQVAVVLIGLSPAIIVPGALNRFVFGKLLFLAAGITLAWIGAPAGRLRRPLVWAIAAASGLLLLAALVSGHPLVSLVGREPRFEGIGVLFVYGAALATGARLVGAADNRPVARALLVALTVAIVAIAFIAVLEAFGLRPLSTNVSRPGSLLGNASDEGALAVLVFGPLVAAAVAERSRLYSLGALASLLVVVLSESRGALVALLVGLVVWAVVGGSRQVRVAALAAAIAAVGVSFAVPVTRDRLTGSSSVARHTVTGRQLLWRETLDLDAHHLLIGIGPSNYESAITHEHTLEWQQRVGPADPPDAPHDLPLQVLTDGGVPGVLAGLAVLGLIAVSGVRAARSRRTESAALAVGALIGATGYAATLLVGLTSPGSTALAAFITGVLVVDPGEAVGEAVGEPVQGRPAPKPAPRSRPNDLAVAGVAGVLAVLFLLAGISEIVLRSAVLDVAAGDAAAANHDFSAAHALRFWDPDLADVAAHAFVTEAAANPDPQLRVDANAWLGRVPGELDSDEQVRLDRELADELAGQLAPAHALLTEALAADPDNPDILLRRGIVDGEQGDYAAAQKDLLESAHIAATSPAPWQDLAVVYGREHRPDAATAARRHAERLGG